MSRDNTKSAFVVTVGLLAIVGLAAVALSAGVVTAEPASLDSRVNVTDSSWAHVGGDQQRTGQGDGAGPASSSSVAWTAGESITGTTVIASGDRFFTSSDSGSVAAVQGDLATGEITQQYLTVEATDVPDIRTAFAYERVTDTLYVSRAGVVDDGVEGAVDAYDASTGAHQWTSTATGSGAALATGPYVVSVDADRERVVALNPSDGEVVWTADLPSGSGSSPPASGVSRVTNDRVVVANNSGGVFVYDIFDGERVGSYDLSGGDALESFSGSPTVVGETVYFGWADGDLDSNGGGIIAAVNVTTNEVVWKKQLPNRVSHPGGLAYADGTLYTPYANFTATNEAGMVAINASTGDREWLFNRPAEAAYSENRPAVTSERVYFASTNVNSTADSKVFAVDRTTGEAVFERNVTEGGHRFAAPVATGETLLVPAEASPLTAIRTEAITQFDDGDGNIDAREVLELIAAYNNNETVSDKPLTATQVLEVISAYNSDSGWQSVTDN